MRNAALASRILRTTISRFGNLPRQTTSMRSLNKHLKVGIVGYGYATATFHAPLIASVSGLSLVAISSSDPAKVRGALPDVDVCDTPQALFARPDIDLVVIPTPNDTHHPLALQALVAGKHVVVDKPFTLDAAQARELILVAGKGRRVLSVFHNRRWATDFLTVQKLLSSGALGRIAHFEAHFDRYRPAVRERWREAAGPGGGLWYDLGAHLLDETLCLFGEPQTISLDLSLQRDAALADDWFHCTLRYGEMRVILHGSVLVANPGPRYAIHGTRGSFTKFGLDPQEDQLKAGLRPGSEGWGIDSRSGTLCLSSDAGLVESTFQNEPGDYSRYYSALRDSILRGTPNPVPAEDALKVMRLIEMGLRSAEEGRVLDARSDRQNARA
jgi:scyllo-inositol 2-dehydrogenase (NADP+)